MLIILWCYARGQMVWVESGVGMEIKSSLEYAL